MTSLIRLPFVPDLVEPASKRIFYVSDGTDVARRAGECHRSYPTGPKRGHTPYGNHEIQHLVGKSDSKSILSREQTLNHLESAIRLRFVLLLFRIAMRAFHKLFAKPKIRR